jgi:hypothetical protein
MYADDLTLIQVIPRESRDSTPGCLNDDLSRLSDICDTWKFRFKPSKSVAMNASLRRASEPLPPVFLNNEEIACSSTVRIVGFLFESKGNWAAYALAKASEGRRRLGMLKRIKRYLSYSSMEKFYKAFIRSKLEYGLLLYWAAADSHLESINAVQRSFLKICKCRLQTLESRRNAAAVGLTCRLLTSTPKGPLSDLVPPPMQSLGRRSARLAVPSHPFQILDQRGPRSLRCFDRSFRGRIPAVWNSLSGLVGVNITEIKAKTKELQRQVVEYESSSSNGNEQ